MRPNWGPRFQVLGSNFNHELTIRVYLGLLGPIIVLGPPGYSFEIMPVAAQRPSASKGN